jgi:hypothetical protein
MASRSLRPKDRVLSVRRRGVLVHTRVEKEHGHDGSSPMNGKQRNVV